VSHSNQDQTKVHTQRFSVLLLVADENFRIDVAQSIAPHFKVCVAERVDGAFELMRQTSFDALITDSAFWQHLSSAHRDALLSLEEQVPIILLYSYQFHEEQVAETLGMMIANTVARFCAENAEGQQAKTKQQLRARPDEHSSERTEIG